MYVCTYVCMYILGQLPALRPAGTRTPHHRVPLTHHRLRATVMMTATLVTAVVMTMVTTVGTEAVVVRATMVMQSHSQSPRPSRPRQEVHPVCRPSGWVAGRWTTGSHFLKTAQSWAGSHQGTQKEQSLAGSVLARMTATNRTAGAQRR